MATVEQRATIDDLMRTEGKAELIKGRIVHFMPTGFRPGIVGANIFMSLRMYRRAGHPGNATPDNVGYAVPELPSGRESFSPDVGYFLGKLPANPMRFIEGAPTFSAEVRSENDYGRVAEEEMAAKRDDYFQAGTLVVWDVDPIAESITIYRRDNPTKPLMVRRGEVADAEPAVPGWRIRVDEVFSQE
ncbi:MAG TPA: Uma2 family endonuclease [Gemmataceae bacterium]|nr:Uma2 family endonuclease [Gemmataceae bacterium]